MKKSKAKKISGTGYLMQVSDTRNLKDADREELIREMTGDENTDDYAFMALDVRKHVYALEGLRQAFAEGVEAKGDDRVQMMMSLMLMFMIEARNRGATEEGKQYVFDAMKAVEEQAAAEMKKEIDDEATRH